MYTERQDKILMSLHQLWPKITEKQTNNNNNQKQTYKVDCVAGLDVVKLLDLNLAQELQGLFVIFCQQCWHLGVIHKLNKGQGQQPKWQTFSLKWLHYWVTESSLHYEHVASGYKQHPLKFCQIYIYGVHEYKG